LAHRNERDGERVEAPPPNRRTLTHLFAPWNGGSERIWAGLSEIDPGSSSNRHRHPNEEIFYVIAGVGEIEVDDVCHRVEAGSTVLVPPDAPHRIFNRGEVLMRVFCAASPAFDRESFGVAHELGRSER
jgi:quercetin dioxygenase-like cupin family protein